MKSSADPQDVTAAVPIRTRRGEILAFAILAIVIWPFVAVGVVGGYGFLVWMYRIVFGPPGPPATIH
jgi:nitrate reductase NapE